jgi:glycolate oxidase
LRPKADPSLALLAQFDSDAAAADAVAAVIGAGHTPSALEVLDAVTTAAVADLGHPDLGLRDATTLLIESDTPDRAQDIDAMARLCDSAGARHVTPGRTVEAARRLRKARAMVPSALRAAAARDCAHPTVFIADVAVPRTRLADLVEAVAAIAEAHAILIATVGHAADGRLHPTVVFDQDDLDAHERARHAHDEVMAAALSMNGTITGEHGVGLLKRDWLGRELDPVAMELHREIKNLLDPTGILNPGKVL